MSNTSISDQSLVEQIKVGNRIAFNDLYNRYWEKLYRFAFNFLKNDSIAQDIVQNIFLDLWNRKSTIEITNISSYFFQSVRFQSLKELKRLPQLDIHEQYFQEEFSSRITENEVDYNELKENLTRCLDDFPDKQRRIFEMSRFESMSNKEIAQELDLSPRTVEWHIHSVLKSLKSSLTNNFCLLLFTFCYQ